MEPEHRNPPPDGWGQDYLSHFLDTADQNRFATFVHMPHEYGKLRELDHLFMLPSLSLWRVRDDQSASASLFHRAHGFFRAACASAMAGQIAESFAMCRAMLEAAGYAIHISKNAGLDAVWLNRHEEGGLKAVTNAFKISAVRETVENLSKEAAERFSRLYQDSIDMGAHPNERSISPSLQITKDGDEHIIRSLLLNPGGVSQQYAMISVARSGAVSLELLIDVFRERFDELEGTQKFEVARQGL